MELQLVKAGKPPRRGYKVATVVLRGSPQDEWMEWVSTRAMEGSTMTSVGGGETLL